MAPRLIDILGRCGARMGEVESKEKTLQEQALREVRLCLCLTGWFWGSTSLILSIETIGCVFWFFL